MLVQLPVKQISERWEVFREVLEECIPVTLDRKPDWLTSCLMLAMLGHIQCWFCYEPLDPSDEFYAALITKKIYDDLSGQQALLVYALKVFKPAKKQTRIEDLQTLARCASAMGIRRITAFCSHPIVLNALKKAFPHLSAETYVTVPIEGEE